MTRRTVDVVVLGGQVGALASACVLARRGLSVLQVEHEGLADGYRDGDRAFPLGPILAPGPKASAVTAALLDELALTQEAARRLRPLRTLQVLGPGLRLTLPIEGDPGPELVRALGPEAAGTARALADLVEADRALDPVLAQRPPLPPAGLAERWRTWRTLRGATPPEPDPALAPETPVGRALHFLGDLASHLDVEAPTPLHATRRLARALRGPVQWADPQPPAPPLGQLLRQRLKALGGESLAGGRAVAESLVLERGRVAGVKITGDKTDYRCRFAVSGLDAPALKRLLPLEGRRKAFDARLELLRPRAFLFTTHLVLAREGWPPGLGELAVHLPVPLVEGEADQPMLLQRFPAYTADGTLREDEWVLQVSVHVPEGRRELGEDWLENLQARMIVALEGDLLPFVRRHLRGISSPYIASRGPARGSRLTPHLLLESARPPAYGVGGLPVATPYRNLFLASREILPGLGQEGQILAGWQAADAVAAQAHKHDPLKKQ